MAPAPIRILEKDNNRRGDLFGRLMADLLVALGYEQPRLNVHKSGRELDLVANHRLEPRRAIAECKATAEPIGGDAINKFVGALDAEHKTEPPVIGYFVSLSGFKETAREQEKQGRRTPIVLLDGVRVAAELIQGRILIAETRATEFAGRCVAFPSPALQLETVELLAHERGWIWAVYYARGKARSHFVLIHSDGTPLALAVAEEVIDSDRACGGEMWKLSCLNPAPVKSDTEATKAAALASYRQYLETECGFIQLDGLPADGAVESRLRLEDLFVPLHVDLPHQEKKRQEIGAVLTEHSRLAILAAPGGGKSTLLKRLAVAYSDPARRAQVSDDLPSRDWLPLFFRCRELRSLAREPFAELLEALSRRELIRHHALAFRTEVDAALLAGRVLLLVDGLDEISDPGDRAAFVCTIRSALQAYPGTSLVVTSREAGFRHVAAHLAPVCIQATLSPFDEEDVRRLTGAWHREVVGDTEKVRAEAEQLAAIIVANDRIRSLAANPLLLTTLLLVKRWVGLLPTRRAVLYGKAIDVLLMTWNTEGHAPIPEEEALPQLCYVASAMMFQGIQKLSRPRLISLLKEAREALPAELGFVRDTVAQFVHRVEDRSSLLMMTGHDVEDGQLVEFFEFRHLTFQEFLTARALIKSWHPGRREDTLASVLEPYLEEERWQEIIPLAAVLGGRESETLVRELIRRAEHLDDRTNLYPPLTLRSLVNCLADEVAARPETIRSALQQVVRLGEFWNNVNASILLCQGKYGRLLREEAAYTLLSSKTHLHNAAGILATSVWYQMPEAPGTDKDRRLAESFLRMMQDSERLCRLEGALGSKELFYRLAQSGKVHLVDAESVGKIGVSLVQMLWAEDPPEQLVASWALAWLGGTRAWVLPEAPRLIGRLFDLWQQSPDADVRDFSGFSLAMQRIEPRDGDWSYWIPAAQARQALEGRARSPRERDAALIVAFYLRLRSDDRIGLEVRERLRETEAIYAVTLRELRNQLETAPAPSTP